MDKCFAENKFGNIVVYLVMSSFSRCLIFLKRTSKVKKVFFLLAYVVSHCWPKDFQYLPYKRDQIVTPP